MSSLEAFILGLLQGLTEFLPISSSAHLKLAKIFFQIQESESLILFDLICHLGTLTAIIFYLRKEIASLIHTDRHRLSLLFIGTLPLIPVYFLLKPLREMAMQAHLLGFFLMLTALILFLGQRIRFRRKEIISFKRQMHDVLWIGAMQGAALIPGISRSASTISTAKILGWKMQDAVRFSFLLSIPTIIGGNCLELLKLSLTSHFSCSISVTSCLIGYASALGMGLWVVKYAIRLLEKGNLSPFAWYCLLTGTLVTIYLNR